MIPLPKTDLPDLVAERPGPHLSAYLPEVIDSGGSLAFRLGKRFQRGPNDWSGWYDFDTAELELTRHAELLRENGYTSRTAVFLADGFTRVLDLGGGGVDTVVAGSHFYIKPLVAAIQADRPFHLLTLSRRRALLFSGSARGLTPVPVPDLPDGIDDPGLARLHAKAHTLHTVGRTHGGAVEAAFHGHADGESDRKRDLERYFRRVETAVTPTLQGEDWPLVLAAVEEELALYRRLNTYPHLFDTGVVGSPDHRSAEELHRDVWPMIADGLHPDADTAVRKYHELRGTGRTADEIAELVCAAADGQLGTLLVSPDRQVWGRYDPRGREVTVHPIREPGDDELTNLAAVHVLRHGGAVHTVSDADLDGRPALGLRRLPMAKHGKGGPS